ncbi:MAG TPA: aminotransferase class I/II-fold pyridoxal phosphate-dependent enzyme, partial [Verrucomicrobiae bacterium]
RVFRHNDLESLEDKLRWATAHRPAGGQIFIITESIFSMDGDAAPLTEIVQLKERYEATLMVDEAHATGLLGPQGRGLIHELGLSGRIEIQMGTLGKALGASGGYICGQRVLIDYLVNRARSFIFSTAPVPAAAAAALAGLQIAASSEGDERRRHCRELGDFFERSTRAFKLPTTPARGMIRPIMMGDETAALEAAAALQKQNVFVPAIRYPTVARGAARLRVCLTAAHTGMDVAQLCDALNQTALTARAHA